MGKLMCANDVLNLNEFDISKDDEECNCKLKAVCIKIKYRPELNVHSNMDEFLGSRFIHVVKRNGQSANFLYYNWLKIMMNFCKMILEINSDTSETIRKFHLLTIVNMKKVTIVKMMKKMKKTKIMKEFRK